MAADVHLYIGRAGTGKTHALYEAIHEAALARRKAVLLVPAQFTYEAERALSSMQGGLLGVQVLSAGRLGERAARAADRPFLSAQGRRMVIRRECYRNKAKLRAFGPVATHAGFATRMDRILVKCKQHLITPAMVEAAAAALPQEDALALKLHDIALLYGAVQSYMQANYIDSEDAQNALIQSLPHSFLAGADVFFDGFEYVNGQMYALLQALLPIARTLTCVFCMDTQNALDRALFLPEQAIYERLREMAASFGCRVMERVFEQTAPGKAKALAHMEAHLFAPAFTPFLEEAHALQIVGASDRVLEVEALADAVVEAARSGVRYRDMAVIASDLRAYAPAVQRAFALRNIPLFMDAHRDLPGHPVAELMLCAMRAATGGFFATELLRILKTRLLDVEQADIEAFESLCLRRGYVGGKVFLSPFLDDPGAERARGALMPPLVALKEKLALKSAGDKAKAIYGYLSALQIQQKLSAQVEQLRANGRFTLMEEHAQVWGILMEMLEQLHAILGGAQLSNRECIEVLTEAMSAYRVGVIPATADQVLLGDMVRTRSQNVEALFVIGCNEGLLPMPQADDDMLDDAELDVLAAQGFRVWGNLQSREQNDRLAIYRALSKARRKLYVSYAYSDGNRQLLTAQLVERMRALCPQHARAQAHMQLPQTERSGFAQLMREFEENTPLHRALRAYYGQTPVYEERLARMEAFRKAPTAPEALGRATAKKLYGSNYYGSVSRLETFRACPYQHFLKYGLRVYPRREYRVQRVDVGNFAHMALERFVQALQKGAQPIDAYARSHVDALLDALLPDCLAQYEDGLLFATSRARALQPFYVEAVREAAWAMVKSLQAGAFVPVQTERRFGLEGGLSPVILPVKDGTAQLGGVIDRIDKTQDGMVRVVDYKTGSADWKYGALADGLSLQLPIYLHAATRQGGIPAGMFYQPVKAPVPDEGEDDNGEALRLRGVLQSDEPVIRSTEAQLAGKSAVVSGLVRNKDSSLGKRSPVLSTQQMQSLMQFALKKAGEVATELLSGRIAPRPVERGASSTCTYCDYRSVCNFDKRLGSKVRRLAQMDKDAFFACCKEDTHEVD